MLTRKPSERIVIGDGPDRITVTVVGVLDDGSAGKVRLGIDAPRSVVIVREELTTRVIPTPRPEGR